MIEFETLKDVCGRVHAVLVQQEFGQGGVDALFEVMTAIRDLYVHVEPMRVSGQVVVFRRVGSSEEPIASGRQCASFELLVEEARQGVVLEIATNGARYVHAPSEISVEELAKTAVVYEYQSGREFFSAGARREEVIRLDRTSLSQFCGHTFFTLGEALREYRLTQIRHSSCLIFDAVWSDGRRLLLKQKPEMLMRRSLTAFLKARLGASYEVRPEQIMDETHPVDIKVTRTLTNRLMIIEIKWLGDSVDDVGKITTSYRDARARDGAKQLADYLDQNRQQAPANVTHGFLVVVDARRRGLDDSASVPTHGDAYFYDHKEINFEPAYHNLRDDFDPPLRMFVEPRLPS